MLLQKDRKLRDLNERVLKAGAALYVGANDILYAWPANPIDKNPALEAEICENAKDLKAWLKISAWTSR